MVNTQKHFNLELKSNALINKIMILAFTLMPSINVSFVSSQTKDEGFIPIFDGRTLTNWEGDPNY